MMTFKFYGHKVTFDEGKLQADDEVTYTLLSPLVSFSEGGPEEGDPLINAITSIFGKASVSDVVHDDDPFIIY